MTLSGHSHLFNGVLFSPDGRRIASGSSDKTIKIWDTTTGQLEKTLVALAGREKVLGKEHPDTLTSVSNLAGVLQNQGKYTAAEEMNRVFAL